LAVFGRAYTEITSLRFLTSNLEALAFNEALVWVPVRKGVGSSFNLIFRINLTDRERGPLSQVLVNRLNSRLESVLGVSNPDHSISLLVRLSATVHAIFTSGFDLFLFVIGDALGTLAEFFLNGIELDRLQVGRDIERTTRTILLLDSTTRLWRKRYF